MSEYLLNAENIDEISSQAAQFLSDNGADKRDVTRLRLILEEVLLRYSNMLGEDACCNFKCQKKLGRAMISLSTPGISYNPLTDTAEEGGELLYHLTAPLGTGPVWRYQQGCNRISYTLPKQRKLSFSAQMLLAMALAIVLAFLARFLPESAQSFLINDLFQPAFDVLTGLIAAVAGPMIFLSLAWGVCTIGDAEMLGRIGKKMLGRFMGMMGVQIAATIGICLLMFRYGSAGSTSFIFSDVYQLLLDIIPTNLFNPFVAGNNVQLIVIAIAVGLALLLLGERVSAVTTLTEQANIAIQFIMRGVSSIIPISIFFSVFNIILSGQFLSAAGAYKQLVALFICCFVALGLNTVIVCVRYGVKPLLLWKKTLPAFLVGVTTASATIALPINMETCQDKLGIDSKITDFGIPLAMVVCKSGTAIVYACISFGMAEMFSVAITPGWIILAGILSIVLAAATPTIPGGEITCFAILLTQLNIPMDSLPIIIALNMIMTFFSTGVNIFCHEAMLTDLAGKMGMLDRDVLRNK